MSRKKPTALAAKTRARYHSQGWVGGNVQTRNKYGSKDLLGFIDEVYLKDGVVVGAQVCNASTRAEHLRTILGCPDFPRWCAEKGKVALCSWALRPMDGIPGKRKVWVEREEWITPDFIDSKTYGKSMLLADSGITRTDIIDKVVDVSKPEEFPRGF